MPNKVGLIFALLLIGQQGLGNFFMGTGPLLPIGWRILQAVRQWQEKLLRGRHSFFVRHLQQANQLLS
jgi:hypothetical protein